MAGLMTPGAARMNSSSSMLDDAKDSSFVVGAMLGLSDAANNEKVDVDEADDRCDDRDRRGAGRL